MINYELEFGVSEVAELLEVDKKTVKDWSYHFSEYLSPNANPDKGIVRRFSIQDICTLGYISMYWEDSPDFENIKYGLNSNDQFEYPYNELATQITPIFREFSDELLGGKIWMIGGMADLNDLLFLANSYKKAGDILIDSGIADEDNRDIAYPALFNYRHSVELFLKSIIPQNENIHDLKILYNKFKILLKNEFDSIPPKWFKNVIFAFDEFDSKSTTFRYAVRINYHEMFIDLAHIKKIMNWFSESIQRINNRLKEKTSIVP